MNLYIVPIDLSLDSQSKCNTSVDVGRPRPPEAITLAFLKIAGRRFAEWRIGILRRLETLRAEVVAAKAWTLVSNPYPLDLVH